MNEAHLQHIITDALELYVEDTDEALRVQTFEEAGVLTNNTGLVVDIDGAKFHLTIVQVS